MTEVEKIIAVEKEILFQRDLIASAYCRHPTHRLVEEDRYSIGRFLAEFDIRVAQCHST
jgi:2-keto-3-deoxy-L-arabinonate dehydratase